jgi:hypothetical protein
MSRLDLWYTAPYKSREREHPVGLSCRFDRTVYESLYRDSKTVGISLNSLITSIIRKYMSWDKYAEELGFIPLPKDAVRMVFENVDDNRIREIGSYVGATLSRDMILFMFDTIESRNIISFLNMSFANYGMVKHNTSENAHEIIVHHAISRKFSNYLANVANAMADELSLGLVITHCDPRILGIRIEGNY